MSEEDLKAFYTIWLERPDFHSNDPGFLYNCISTCDSCPFSCYLNLTCMERENKLIEWIKDKHLHPERFI